MPVVADDFEQEAEREVAATTGFAAAAAQEGEKMKLVHQVCISPGLGFPLDTENMISIQSGPSSSGSAAQLSLRPNLYPCSKRPS
jgi:hypothetical protein